jgi:hypothetical protein
MDRKFFDRTHESILYDSTEGSMPIVVTAFSQYLTIEEELQIRQQFHNTWRWNNQVMERHATRICSGMGRQT